MTADEFVHKWKYGWLRPDHLTAKDSWRDKSLMKADLEEMLQQAKNDVMDIPVESIRAKEDMR